MTFIYVVGVTSRIKYFQKNYLNRLRMEPKNTQSQLHPAVALEQNTAEKFGSPRRGSYRMSMSGQNRQRVPEILISVLRGKVQESKSNHSGNQDRPNRKSKYGGMLKSKVRDFVTKITICEICEGEMKKGKNKKQGVYISDCEHKDNFCESCLHHYTIYKVKSFEEVLCPHEGCPAVLDTTASFYKNLPADIQKSYKKIHQFYVTSQDPDLRLCPREDCEGIIKTSEENVMVCNECKRSFCSKCLLAVHQGECDNQEVQFFESNLHYRQCKKCKFIIQKNQGCNHMTCRCGYQFCYVCGEIWAPKHYGEHDQNGNVVEPPEGAAGANNNDDDCCECCHCRCVEQTCGPTCACIIKAPLKLVLLILFVVLMVFIFMFRDLWVLTGMVIFCIFAGMFAYSCQIISDLEGCLCILAVLFFPIVMILGIGLAFKEVFSDIVPEACSENCQMYSEGVQGICEL